VSIRITGQHQLAAWDAGVLPQVERVRPGLWSIPVPIPDNPLRYVLVYCLELDSGVAIVDAGWNTDDAWDALCAGLATAGGSISDVRAVLVTHLHPDHYGLAGRVRDASGAWVGLHPRDAALLNLGHVALDEMVATMSQLVADSGMPDDRLAALAHAAKVRASHVAFGEPDVMLDDQARPDLPGWDLRAVWTPGHSPGHVCFHSESRRLLLSGDHVLPRISPHVSVHTQHSPNPLADYLDSLGRVRDLPVDEVLPAHEYRFARLARRVDQLVEHHAERCAEIEAALRARPGSTSWELTAELTWSRSWGDIPAVMRGAANSETFAHLVLLESQGRVRRDVGQPARFHVASQAVGAGQV
jgi:glyoxylase-like metal-dependent hydrolase (beta-lactamase superfamily II)